MARWLKAHNHSCRGPKNDAQLPVISSLGRSGTSSLCGHRNSLSPLRCQCLPLQQQQLCSYVITCRQETFHCPLCGLCTFNSARQAQLTHHLCLFTSSLLPLSPHCLFSLLLCLSVSLLSPLQHAFHSPPPPIKLLHYLVHVVCLLSGTPWRGLPKGTCYRVTSFLFILSTGKSWSTQRAWLHLDFSQSNTLPRFCVFIYCRGFKLNWVSTSNSATCCQMIRQQLLSAGWL